LAPGKWTAMTKTPALPSFATTAPKITQELKWTIPELRFGFGKQSPS
jgi:hypothetical protein